MFYVKTCNKLKQKQHIPSIQSIPQQQPKNCIFIPKIKCAFHQNQFITNFCTCISCLLPLCPSCIKIHTDQHITIKKINPQYQPITGLLQQIYGQVEQMLLINNDNYKKILQITTKINIFRSTIKQKINSLKINIFNYIQQHFKNIYSNLQQQINNMNYIQMLALYKQQIKKNIFGLKNIANSFNPQNEKIMRIIIKYKNGQIQKQIQKFNINFISFLDKVNDNFITFTVRQDYKNIIQNYLNDIKKIQITDVKPIQSIPNISIKLKDVYEKTTEQNKKQIIRSIGNILAKSSVTKQNHQLQLCQQGWKTMSHLSKIQTPSKQNRDQRRRSASKGKGLSLMQINHVLNQPPYAHRGKVCKAINICPLGQFNRPPTKRDR